MVNGIMFGLFFSLAIFGIVLAILMIGDTLIKLNRKIKGTHLKEKLNADTRSQETNPIRALHLLDQGKAPDFFKKEVR